MNVWRRTAGVYVILQVESSCILGFGALYGLIMWLCIVCLYPHVTIEWPVILHSVGPLHSNLEYTISAQKEGFVLTAVDGTVGDFNAFALAGVTFEVLV